MLPQRRLRGGNLRDEPLGVRQHNRDFHSRARFERLQLEANGGLFCRLLSVSELLFAAFRQRFLRSSAPLDAAGRAFIQCVVPVHVLSK